MKKASLRKHIKAGQRGLNQGWSFFRKDFDVLYGGIMQQCNYLVGGTPGSGKTSFADQVFIYPLIRHAERGKTVHILYYGLDVNPEELEARFVLNRLYSKHRRVIPGGYMDLMGYRFDRRKLSQDLKAPIKEALEAYENMACTFELHTRPVSPDQIYDRFREVCAEVGVRKKNKSGATVGARMPHDRMVLLYIDHLSRLRGDRTKQAIDAMSRYATEIRMNYGGTTVALQQMRHEASGPERTKTGQFFPIPSDFKDSTNPHEDFMVTWGLFQPAEALGKMKSPGDVKNLENKYLGGINSDMYRDVLTTATNLKNRNGPSKRTHRMAFLKPMFYMEHWNENKISKYLKWQQLLEKEVKDAVAAARTRS